MSQKRKTQKPRAMGGKNSYARGKVLLDASGENPHGRRSSRKPLRRPRTSAGDIRDSSSVPGSGRSPGGGHGNPLQYSCLENLMDKGAWWATVHRVAPPPGDLPDPGIEPASLASLLHCRQILHCLSLSLRLCASNFKC